MAERFEQIERYLETTDQIEDALRSYSESLGEFGRSFVDEAWSFWEMPYRTYNTLLGNEGDPSEPASYHNLVALAR